MALDARRLADVIHREMVQLIALMGTAVVAFFLTRAAAAGNHRMQSEDAAEWFRRGEAAIAAGRHDAAVDAFRHAVARARSNRGYGLSLARALAEGGDFDGARTQLMALRDDAPDDPDVNVALARVASSRGDATEARRFYGNALYAPWPPERSGARDAVRLELVRLLIAHGDTGRAEAELLAAGPAAAGDASRQRELADLFARAGDDRRALEHFERALTIDADSPQALSGAGLAAFRLGDYARARRYLRRAPDADPAVTDAREVVEFVLNDDPLAARLGAGERSRRFARLLTRAAERLSACAPADGAGEAAALQRDVHAAVAPSGGRRPRALDQDTVEAGLETMVKVESYAAASRCPGETPRDRAIVLIGRLHGAVPQ